MQETKPKRPKKLKYFVKRARNAFKCGTAKTSANKKKLEDSKKKKKSCAYTHIWQVFCVLNFRHCT